MQNNIGAFLTKRAYLSPDREAYVDGTLAHRLTFGALNARCNRLGERVARRRRQARANGSVCC